MKGAGQIKKTKKKQFTYFMPSHNVFFESLRTRSAYPYKIIDRRIGPKDLTLSRTCMSR